MGAPLAGDRVRTSHYPKVTVVLKTANESVTSSTTMQDDDDFSFPLAAGKSYRIEAVLGVSGAAAGDIKVAWVGAGGVAGLSATRYCLGPAAAITDASAATVRTQRANITTVIAYGTDGALQSAIREEFLVETTTSGAAGTLTMQWAQNASSATATVMCAGSYVVITEIDLV